MLRSTRALSQALRFDINKHFTARPDVKSYTMESLGHEGDKRFGYSEPFKLLTDEAISYIRNLTQKEEFLKNTKWVTKFAPFVLRDCSRHDKFLNDWYNCPKSEEYFSKIVGEEMRWLSNTWDGSHINLQEKTKADVKVFDWHMDSQPLTLVINVSEFPGPDDPPAEGGSTWIKLHNSDEVIELKQPEAGYATIFRGSGVFHKAGGANYRRIMYVKTMEFKDVTILDKCEPLFSTQYSDVPDMLSQHLMSRFERIEKQFELMQDPTKQEAVMEVVKEEMVNYKVFAKYAFDIQAGRDTVDTLIEKKLIQNVY